MSETQTTVALQAEKSAELATWAAQIEEQSETPLLAARRLATRLGAHLRPDGDAEFGFWTPELVELEIPAENVFVELYIPLDVIDFDADEQTIRFRRVRVPTHRQGDYTWAVIAGVQAGRRDRVGAFYRLVAREPSGVWRAILDPLAYSVPFGAAAPAEFYDMLGMLDARNDADYFQHLDAVSDPDGVPRVNGPTNMMEIHVNTATPEGTLAGLTAVYVRIARKIAAGEALSPAEQNYVGYDAVQLMPIEPTLIYEAGPSFWEGENDDGSEGEVHVRLRRPDTTNWGYDVLTVASPAPNPIVLSSRRPDELLDLITTLHTFPGKPIKIVLDVVYGHADNQTLPLLNHHYFAGANMYGQNLNYRHPVVRAVLLEMQRRKSNYGVDGIRVDGAQDFKYWIEDEDQLYHDDQYLQLMNNVEQQVAGVRYRSWMIFEDGRPWPRDDWELASSYREVTKLYPNVVQWGPLTFAHNTPFLFTFWISKWWRIEEVMQFGSHWITGVSNHDTLRRGTQVDPQSRINTYLGDTLPEIFENAYDNPATRLFDYAFSPGVPMDFLNANMRGPWSFIRNTDDKWGVKVVSEETYFLDWNVNEERFHQEWAFPRLKAHGFTDLDGLRRFLRALDAAVRITNYSMAALVHLLNNVRPQLDGPEAFTVQNLKQIACDWMDDVYEFCNVSHYTERLDPERTAYSLRVRNFRRQRPWLMNNLTAGDVFDHQRPSNGTVLFYGMRTSPDGREQILFVANMEGAPRTITPLDLPIPNLPQEDWQVTLATPGLPVFSAVQPVTFENSQGVVFTRG